MFARNFAYILAHSKKYWMIFQRPSMASIINFNVATQRQCTESHDHCTNRTILLRVASPRNPTPGYELFPAYRCRNQCSAMICAARLFRRLAPRPHAGCSRLFTAGAWEKPMSDDQFEHMKEILASPSPVGFEAAMTKGWKPILHFTLGEMIHSCMQYLLGDSRNCMWYLHFVSNFCVWSSVHAWSGSTKIENDHDSRK